MDAATRIVPTEEIMHPTSGYGIADGKAVVGDDLRWKILEEARSIDATSRRRNQGGSLDGDDGMRRGEMSDDRFHG